MELIKIFKFSGVPTHKLIYLLNSVLVGSEEYRVINHIIQKRNSSISANFAKKAVSQLIYEYQSQEKQVIRAEIGSKNSEYCTEAEMLAEFQCSYSDLSEHEKAIFRDLKEGDHWNKEQTHQPSHFYTVSNFNF